MSTSSTRYLLTRYYWTHLGLGPMTVRSAGQPVTVIVSDAKPNLGDVGLVLSSKPVVITTAINVWAMCVGKVVTSHVYSDTTTGGTADANTLTSDFTCLVPGYILGANRVIGDTVTVQNSQAQIFLNAGQIGVRIDQIDLCGAARGVAVARGAAKIPSPPLALFGTVHGRAAPTAISTETAPPAPVSLVGSVHGSSTPAATATTTDRIIGTMHGAGAVFATVSLKAAISASVQGRATVTSITSTTAGNFYATQFFPLAA